MFPTRLNLLPPDNQKYLQKMAFTEFIKSTLEMVLFLLAISGITLLCGQWILQEYFNDLAENIVALSNEHVEANKQIKEINLVLKQTSQIQEKYVLWTPVISAVVSTVPDEIIFSAFNLDRNRQNFSFSGTAPTRNDLLDLQQNLESLPFVSSINIPLSQLTEKENLSFSFNAVVDINSF